MVFLTLGHAKVAVLKREREKLIVIAGPFNRMVVHKNGDWSRKRWPKNSIRRVSKLVVFPDLGLLGSRPVSCQTDVKFENYRVLKPNSTNL